MLAPAMSCQRLTFPLGCVFSLLVPAAATQAPPPADDGSRPNVVLVMVDDLGWGDLGFQGSTVAHTPHLDAMAAAGLRFTRFYAQSPVCSPTRASCLTGQHPYRHGIVGANRGHLGADAPNLAEELRAAGYRTGHFGKWHLGTLTTTLVESNRGGPRGAEHYAPPWDRGFDVCFSTEAKVPTFDPMRDPKTGGDYGTHFWTGPGQRVVDDLTGDTSELTMDRAERFLRTCFDEKAPFLCVIWFHTPHLPLVAGEADLARFAELPDDARRFHGAVTAMDRQVGRLRALLKRAEARDDTIVWFCSDNGPEGRSSAPGATGPFRGRKRSLLEGGVRVPGIVEWPAVVRPGSTTDSPATTTDIAHTVLDACGLEPLAKRHPDATFDGVSVLPTLSGEPARHPAFGFRSARSIAWHDGEWKLFGQIAKDGEINWRLYHLGDDPGESNDLSGTEPDRLAHLIEACLAWRSTLPNA